MQKLFVGGGGFEGVTISAPPPRKILIIHKWTDESAKGGLTQFWERFTMIPCVPKYLKR